MIMFITYFLIGIISFIVIFTRVCKVAKCISVEDVLFPILLSLFWPVPLFFVTLAWIQYFIEKNRGKIWDWADKILDYKIYCKK